MEIQIGTIKFGGDSVYQLSPGIEGLASSDIRTGSGLYAGVDGGYVSSQFYGHRTITLPGFLIARCEDLDNYRRELFTSLAIRRQYPIGITTFSNQNYATAGYITDIKSAISGPTSCEFQITVLCPDPIIYEADENNPQTPKWTTQALTEQTSTTVTNTGTATVYPNITCNPSASQIHAQFANDTVGKDINLQSFGTQSDPITIDMEQRTVMRGSENLASHRTIGSVWWGLEPGNNQIRYLTGGPTGSTATIRYKTGYQGI